MQLLLDRIQSLLRTLLLATLLLSVLLADYALAQTSDEPPLVLDFQEALEMALERNPTLRQSANDVALSEATLAQERGAFYPSLNLSVGPSMRFGPSFDQTTASLTDQRSEALSLSASSSLNLFNGFADVASVQGARLGREASESSFEQTRQSILHQTASQYFQVFMNQEQIRVEEENLEAQRQQLESIQAAYEAGNRPIADVLQQEAAIAQSEQQLIATERDYELSRLQLKQTLHLSPQAEVAFEAPSDELFAAPGERIYDADALVQQALANRNDVTTQRLRIDASEQDIRVARSGYYPSVSLSASTGTNYSSLNSQFAFSDQLTDLNPNGSIVLWRMFAGGSAADTYAFTEVVRTDLRATVSSTGTLSAVETVEVGTQVSGQVEEVYVDFNDHVERGQLLALIDTETLDAELENVRARSQHRSPPPGGCPPGPAPCPPSRACCPGRRAPPFHRRI